jgi:chaperonin GroEL (HSP60 family)
MLELVRPSYGPRGLYKLIVADRQKIILVTKGARLLFQKVQLEHPAAQLMAGAGVSVAREVGGGALSTILLAGEIVRHGTTLLAQGIHPWPLIDACFDALDIASRTIAQMASPRDPRDTQTLSRIAQTALAGGLLRPGEDGLAGLAVQVVQQLGLSEGLKLPWFDYVDFKKIPGGRLEESEVVHGLAFFHEPTHPRMPRHVERPRIGLIRGELRIPEKGQTRHYDHKFLIERPGQYSTFAAQKLTWFSELVARFHSVGANTLLVERGIDPHMAELLANAGILAIRRFAPPEFDRFAPALGARIVSDLADLEEADLGTAEVIEYHRVAGEEWWFIRGCPDPRAVDILLRGFAPQLMDEAERSLRGALGTIRALVQQPAVVPGGGAVEAEIAHQLRERARQLPDRRQMALHQIAEACETVPAVLGQSAGRDPLDLVPELRRQHGAGAASTGVEVANGQVADMLDHGVVEPLRGKQQVIRAAFEVAVTLLRVNDYIIAGRLSEPERKYVERMEGTAPGRMRQIAREHGLDR